MRVYAADIGRREPIDVAIAPFSTGFDGSYDVRDIRDELPKLEDLGVTWVVLRTPAARTRAAYIRAARRFADDVIAPYHD